MYAITRLRTEQPPPPFPSLLPPLLLFGGTVLPPPFALDEDVLSTISMAWAAVAAVSNRALSAASLSACWEYVDDVGGVKHG